MRCSSRKAWARRMNTIKFRGKTSLPTTTTIRSAAIRINPRSWIRSGTACRNLKELFAIRMDFSSSRLWILRKEYREIKLRKRGMGKYMVERWNLGKKVKGKECRRSRSPRSALFRTNKMECHFQEKHRWPSSQRGLGLRKRSRSSVLVRVRTSS